MATLTNKILDILAAISGLVYPVGQCESLQSPPDRTDD